MRAVESNQEMDQFGGLPVSPQAETDDFGGVPVSNSPQSPTDEFGGLAVGSPKQAYIQNQEDVQNQSFLDKTGDVVKGLFSPQLWGDLFNTAKTAVTTAPQLLEPNQEGTSARQDLLNAGLVNASDMSQAAQVQAPKFWNMLTGQKQTPEQLGNEYDETQDYARVRNNIQQLGANPAISQQLSQNGGVGSVLGAVSAPGNATVNPERQNALEPIADPTMYIPVIGADETGVRLGLKMLGRMVEGDALEQIPRAGLTATLAGKTLSGAGAVLGKASGLKDGVNSGLQAVAKSLGANEKLSELAGDHGTEIALAGASHALGLGHSGFIAGALGPAALGKASNALASAGKILQEGEGTVPFFERMAQDAASQGNNLAAKAYQLMDTSGAGTLLTNAAKTVKDSVKATAVTAPLQLPFAGNDPDQMAATIGSNLAAGAVGGAIHEMKPMSARDFQARQDMDSFAMRNKLGSTWDDALQTRTQTYLNRMTQDHPNIDPNSPAAQTFAAQAARSDMGSVATILRSNPGITPTFRTGEGNTHVVSPDGKGSTINIDPTSNSMIPQVIAHELVHHIQAGGQRGEVLNGLLGDPETKTPGSLRSYAPDGTPIDAPEFAQFRNNYAKRLGAEGLESPNAGKQSIADKRAAEEFYAEAVGSVLGGHTNAGELNYARLRRTGGKEGIMDKFFGKNAGSKLNPVKMGFMDNPDGSPSHFNALDWLNKNPALKKITFGYLANKDYLGQMGDKTHQYDNSFGNEERSIDWMKANPNEAFAKYGNDASLRFSPPDAKGNRNFEGVLSPKQEKVLAESQAKELFDKIKKDPKYAREVTTADGKKSTQIIHLDDKVLGSLTHLNPYQKDILIKLNQAVNMAPGNVMRTTYQPALANGKRYEARERTIRHTVPYDIFISQPEGGKGGANILTHVLDIDQMLKNRVQILAAMHKGGLPIDPRYSDQQWFRESLGKMAQAHFAGKKSTDGTGLSDTDRDFLNATMGVTPKVSKEHVEGINNLLDELKEKSGQVNVTSAVKSFRLDRINKMEHAPEWGQIPYQYFDSKRNRRPEDTVPAQGEEPDYLKNDPILHRPDEGNENGNQEVNEQSNDGDLRDIDQNVAKARSNRADQVHSIRERLNSRGEKESGQPLFRPEDIDKAPLDVQGAPHEEATGEGVQRNNLGRENASIGIRPQVGEPDEAGIYAERHAPSESVRSSEAWAPRLVSLQKDRELLKEAGYDTYNNIGHWYPQGVRRLDEKGDVSHVFRQDPVPESEIRKHGYDGPVSTIGELPPKKLSNGEQLKNVASRVVEEGRDYAENLVKPMATVDKTGSGWLPHQLPLPHSQLKDYHTVWIKKDDLPARQDSEDREFSHNGLNFSTQKEDWTEDKNYLAHANFAVMKGPDGNDRVVVWEAQPSFRLAKTTLTKKEPQEPKWTPAGITRSEALERVAKEVQKFAQEKGNLPVVLGDAKTVQHIYGRAGNPTKTFNVDYSSDGYATRAFKRVFEEGKPKPLKKVEFKDKLWMPALKEEDRHAFSGYEFVS